MKYLNILSNKIPRYFIKWNNARRENNRFLLDSKICLEANITFSQVTYDLCNKKPGNFYKQLL